MLGGTEARVVDLSRFALRFAFFAEKTHQFGSDFLSVRPGDAVWASFHHHQLELL